MNHLCGVPGEWFWGRKWSYGEGLAEMRVYVVAIVRYQEWSTISRMFCLGRYGLWRRMRECL